MKRAHFSMPAILAVILFESSAMAGSRYWVEPMTQEEAQAYPLVLPETLSLGRAPRLLALKTLQSGVRMISWDWRKDFVREQCANTELNDSLIRVDCIVVPTNPIQAGQPLFKVYDRRGNVHILQAIQEMEGYAVFINRRIDYLKLSRSPQVLMIIYQPGD